MYIIDIVKYQVASEGECGGTFKHYSPLSPLQPYLCECVRVCVFSGPKKVWLGGSGHGGAVDKGVWEVCLGGAEGGREGV